MLKSLKIDKSSPPFLDTIFLLPFFQLNVKIEGFTLKKFKRFLTELPILHFSELSIYEAKAKIYRLSRRDTNYAKSFGGVWTQLSHPKNR